MSEFAAFSYAENKVSNDALIFGLWSPVTWGTGFPRMTAASDNGDRPLRHTNFVSANYPAEEAEAAYQLLFASSAKVTPLREPFFVEIHSHWTDVMTFHFMHAVPFEFARSAQKIGFDGNDRIIVQHVETGCVEGTFEDHVIRAAEGSIYIIDFAKPSHIRDSAAVERQKRNFVAMPRARAEHWLGPLQDVHGLVIEAAHAVAYVNWLSELKDVLPRHSSLSAAALDRTGALLAQLVGQVRPATSTPTNGRLAARNRACLYIQDQLGRRDLNVENVAASIGVSRAKLFMLFKPDGGVERYIWLSRLEAVRSALSRSEPTRTVTDLAYTYGFRDVAQLSRMFRRQYGAPPTQLKSARSFEITVPLEL